MKETEKMNFWHRQKSEKLAHFKFTEFMSEVRIRGDFAVDEEYALSLLMLDQGVRIAY